MSPWFSPFRAGVLCNRGFLSYAAKARIGATIGAAMGLFALAGCSDSAPQQAMPALPVTTLTMEAAAVPRVLEIMAQTEGAKETEVRARVNGILTRQLYREGETVKAGQALFQIERDVYENTYASAKARAAQTALERQRAEKLLAIHGVSRREYDAAVSADDVAQADFRQARLNLSWTTVVAPVDGVTGRAEKSEGNLVSAGADSLLTVIRQDDPIWARFSLSEGDVSKLPGKRLTPETVTGVELILPDGSVYPLPGKLNFMASNIDATLGTQQLRAEFPNPDGLLLPGQFVRIRLHAGAHENAFLVPQVAVQQTERGDVLMLADAQNKVEPRVVKTGDWLGKDWVILGGLKPGDRVIVDNLMKLRPGAAVAPHAPQPQKAPESAPAPAPETPQADELSAPAPKTADKQE
ncbi:MAG: efflux RND transporter periplasmic adaptor subunit [Zoogloeaceae bacterium]|jgi:membrane fusion protein (multidrug efflux system)|nr:efflux RND transporter periplasmic adaptor subunit [Zoogloeaceae bacterium]